MAISLRLEPEHLKRVITATASVIALFPSHGVAQSTSVTSLDEIVVTATRRETVLQETPLAVTAYTAEQLTNSGVRDLRDLATFTPGLTMGSGEAQGAVPISIRGVGQNDLGIGADGPNAIYLDGVYLARPYMNLFGIADIERIEVLRGPQGTLYGRNATGGAINFITLRPGDDARAEVTARYGDYSAWGAAAVLMGPLSSTVSGKLAISGSGHDGYTKHEVTGKDLDPEETFDVRGALRWRPNDKLDVQLNVDSGYHNAPVVFHLSTQPNFQYDKINIDTKPYEDRDYSGGSLEAAYDLGGMQFVSITGYRQVELRNQVDTDAGPAKIVVFGQFDEQSQWSQEFRLASNSDGRFQWLGGLYYFGESSSTYTPLYIDFTTLLGLPSPTQQNINAKNRTDAYAIFGQTTYKFTDDLSLTVGLRWSEETKKFTFEQAFTVDMPPLFNTYPQSVQETKWSDVSPRIALDYQITPDVLLYASAAEGFKSGGSTTVSLITTPTPNVFDPETLRAYEAGLKSEWLDRRLRLNATAFYYDYKDLQVRTSDQFGFVVVRNAAAATVQGLELEIFWRPMNGLDLNAVAALLDATYDKFIDPYAGTDYAGDHLNRAPEQKISLGAQYTVSLAGGSNLTFRAEYDHESRIYHQPGDLVQFSRDPTQLFNARATYRAQGGRWTVSLFGQNLTDERYIGHSFPVLGTPRSAVTPPRTYGIELRYSL